MSFTPHEATAYREMDARLDPYSCRTDADLKARLEKLDDIMAWAAKLEDRQLRKAYEGLRRYFRSELERHVEDAKRETETQRIIATAPRPPH